MVRNSYTAVVERNVEWKGDFASEPYECGWATEAIFFVRTLGGSGKGGTAHVEISPDGMHWCAEGTEFALPAEEGGVTFCRVAHFGNWLRISGSTSGSVRVLVTLSLKE